MEEFVQSLEAPRKILIMVKAGGATDDTIEQLVPFLSEGDILSMEGMPFFPIRKEAAESCKIRGFALSAPAFQEVKKVR